MRATGATYEMQELYAVNICLLACLLACFYVNRTKLRAPPNYADVVGVAMMSAFAAHAPNSAETAFQGLRAIANLAESDAGNNRLLQEKGAAEGKPWG